MCIRDRLRADHTGDFPVADGGILAHALLLQAGQGSRRGIRFLPCGHAVNVGQRHKSLGGFQTLGKHSNGKLVTKVNRLEFDDILAGLDLGSVVYPKMCIRDRYEDGIAKEFAALGLI